VVSRTEIENLRATAAIFSASRPRWPAVTGQQVSGQGSRHQLQRPAGAQQQHLAGRSGRQRRLNGNTRQTISQEAVRVFQVVTSQFAPEFGRAAGGLVNIVSRSGTNQFRGNAFLYVRDESMDARDAFVTEGKPEFQRQNFGGTFGGPLKRNRTFFFGAFERMQRDESDVITISDSAGGGHQRGAGRTTDSQQHGHLDLERHLSDHASRHTGLVQGDHSLNANNTLGFRYTYGKSLEENAAVWASAASSPSPGAAGCAAPTSRSWRRGRTSCSPTLLGEARLQVAPRELTSTPTTRSARASRCRGRHVGPQHQLPGPPQRDHHARQLHPELAARLALPSRSAATSRTSPRRRRSR